MNQIQRLYACIFGIEGSGSGKTNDRQLQCSVDRWMTDSQIKCWSGVINIPRIGSSFSPESFERSSFVVLHVLKLFGKGRGPAQCDFKLGHMKCKSRSSFKICLPFVNLLKKLTSNINIVHSYFGVPRSKSPSSSFLASRQQCRQKGSFLCPEVASQFSGTGPSYFVNKIVSTASLSLLSSLRDACQGIFCGLK